MSMSSLLAAIATNVKAELPSLRECLAHDGQFTDRDLKRYITTDPSVYVSCLGSVDSEDQDDDLVVSAQWVMVVVTRRSYNEGDVASRTTTALDLIEQLMFLIRNNGGASSWGSLTNGPAEKIRSRILFNEETDKRGVSLWVITWEQAVSVGQFDGEALDDFLRAVTEHDVNGSGNLDTFTTHLPGPTP